MFITLHYARGAGPGSQRVTDQDWTRAGLGPDCDRLPARGRPSLAGLHGAAGPRPAGGASLIYRHGTRRLGVRLGVPGRHRRAFNWASESRSGPGSGLPVAESGHCHGGTVARCARHSVSFAVLMLVSIHASQWTVLWDSLQKGENWGIKQPAMNQYVSILLHITCISCNIEMGITQYYSILHGNIILLNITCNIG